MFLLPLILLLKLGVIGGEKRCISVSNKHMDVVLNPLLKHASALVRENFSYCSLTSKLNYCFCWGICSNLSFVVQKSLSQQMFCEPDLFF